MQATRLQSHLDSLTALPEKLRNTAQLYINYLIRNLSEDNLRFVFIDVMRTNPYLLTIGQQSAQIYEGYVKIYHGGNSYTLFDKDLDKSKPFH